MSWQLAEKSLSLTFGFAFTLLMAQHLGAEIFGVYSFYIAAASLLTPLYQFGIGRQLLGEFAQGKSNALTISTALKIRGVASLVFCFIAFALFTLIYEDEYSAWLLLVLLVGHYFTVLEVFEFHLHSKGKFQSLSKVKICIYLIGFIFKVIALFNLNSLLALFLIIAGEQALIMSFTCLLANREGSSNISGFSLGTAKRLLSRSKYLVLSGFAATIYLKIDIIMLEYYVSAAQLGTYSLAAKLSEASMFIAIAICTVQGPSIIKAYRTNNDDFTKLTLNAFVKLTMSAFVIILLTLLLAKPLILLIFGQEFQHSASVLGITIFALPFLFYRQLISYLIIATDFTKFSLVSHLLGAGINLSLNLLLIPLYGIMGAAWATLFAYAAAGYLSLWLFQRTRFITKLIHNSIHPGLLRMITNT